MEPQRIKVFDDVSVGMIVQLSPASAQVHEDWRTIPGQVFIETTPGKMFEIPDRFDTKATVEFLGMSPNAANTIYDTWFEARMTGQSVLSNRPILYAVLNYVELLEAQNNAFFLHHDWLQALQRMGCQHSLAQAIMDPRFTDIRMQKSAAGWLKTTIWERWEMLEGLNEKVRKQRNAGGSLGSPDPSTSQLSQTQRATSCFEGKGSGFSSTKIATSQPSTALDRRKIVFKGGSYDRLAAVHRMDTSLDLLSIVSQPPTDFHPNNQFLLYFTRQKECAKHYCAYSSRRTEGIHVGILCMAVPSDILDGSYEVVGDEWRDLVWYSNNLRAQAELDKPGLPLHLDHIEKQTVLTGPILDQAREAVQKLTTKDHLQCCKLNIKGGITTASQTVFQGKTVREDLKARCQGFVWLEDVTST